MRKPTKPELPPHKRARETPVRDAAHDSACPRRRCDQAVRRSADGSASRPGQACPGKFFPALQAPSRRSTTKWRPLGLWRSTSSLHTRRAGVYGGAHGAVCRAPNLWILRPRTAPYLRYKNTLGILSALYLYLRYSKSPIPKVSKHLRYLRYSIPVP